MARWRTGWALVTTLLIVMAIPTVDVQAQQIVLKGGTIQKTDHPHYMLLVEFGKRLAAKTNNRVRVDIFPAAQLGSEQDMFQQQMRGEGVDVLVLPPGNMEAFVKEVGFFELYFLFNDLTHWKRAIWGPIGAKMADLVEKKTDVKVIGYYGGSERIITSRSKAVKSLDDLKGYRMRIFSAGVMARSWEALGTIPTLIAFTELYSGLVAGLVDGQENELPTILSARLYEPCKLMTLTNHQIIVRFFTISGKKFRSLPPDIQQAILEAGREAVEFEVGLEQDISAKAMDSFKGYGVQFFPIDRRPFIERLEPFNRKIAQELGVELLLDGIIQLR